MAKAKTKMPEAPKVPERLQVQINAKYLRALRHICARNDIRYYLNGVHLRAGHFGKEYAATDGHKIAVFKEHWAADEVAQDLNLIIPRVVCVGIKFPKRFDKAWLKPIGATQWALDTGVEPGQVFSPIDGKFPEWQKVIPEKCSGQPGAYNWGYLAAFNACLKDTVGGAYGAEVWQNGADGAAIVTHQSASFIGVLMPLRSGGGPTIPGWARDYVKNNVALKKSEQIEADARLKDNAKAVEAA